MKNIYLHIGFFKTGTTSIQNYLYNNKEYFEVKGYLYPLGYCDPIEKSHSHLSCSLLRDLNMFLDGVYPIYPHSSQFYWEELFKEIENSSCENILLISEHFCDFSRDESIVHSIINSVKHRLSNFNIQVILYLRRIDHYLISIYCEGVRKGYRDASVGGFFQELLEEESFHIHQDKVIAPWVDVFGKENVILRYFRHPSHVDFDVIEDFLVCVGLPDEKPDRIIKENVTTPLGSIYIQRLFNISNRLADSGQIYRNLISEIDFVTDEMISSLSHVILDVSTRIEKFMPGYISLYGDAGVLENSAAYFRYAFSQIEDSFSSNDTRLDNKLLSITFLQQRQILDKFERYEAYLQSSLLIKICKKLKFI